MKLRPPAVKVIVSLPAVIDKLAPEESSWTVPTLSVPLIVASLLTVRAVPTPVSVALTPVNVPVWSTLSLLELLTSRLIRLPVKPLAALIIALPATVAVVPLWLTIELPSVPLLVKTDRSPSVPVPVRPPPVPAQLPVFRQIVAVLAPDQAGCR